MEFQTLKYNITTFILLMLGIITLAGCNITKNVPKKRLLLVDNKIEINGEQKSEAPLNPYIIQKSNVKFIVPIQLYFYNLGNPKYIESWKERIQKYSDSTYFFTKLLSYKQMVGYANFIKKNNEWLFKNGEPPIILDTIKTNKTLNTLYQYYLDQGYFKSKTSYEIDTISDKKAIVKYKISTDRPFELDTIKVKIASPIIDSLYWKNNKKTRIKTKKIFLRENFEKEADRLTAIFRNNGVYHFNKYAINFREIDSTRADYKTNVLVDIANRIIEVDDTLKEIPYQISHIERVNVFTDISYVNKNTTIKDSIRYNGMNLYAENRLNYKPKFLSRSIFLHTGDVYSDENLELTRKHLRSLQNFRSVKINFEEKEENKLTANIYLLPVKRFRITTETEITHSNLKPFGVSGKLSFNNNNTFRGNEILQLSLQGAFLNNTTFEGNLFNAWEVGADLSFKVPRISFPFKIEKVIPQKMSPKTTFTFGSSLQKNIGLDKQRFTGIMEYNWQATLKINHSLELINTQFIKNLNVPSYFNVYSSEYAKLSEIQTEYFPDYELDKNSALSFLNYTLADINFEQAQSEAYDLVKNIYYRHLIITEDVLVPSVGYAYTYNSQTNYKDTEFVFYKIRLSSAGLIGNLISKKNVEGVNQLFDTNVAQYFKLDLEYKKHWAMKWGNVLAFRANMGLAIPYGNSDIIPFSRSYFAGGTNDIRAWKIYELGPGSERSGLEFNVGNFKLLSSLEYRFDIISSLKGALFLDAGNIWDIVNSDLTTQKASFDGFSSLKDVGIGTGIGIRYDFSFLVFRGDFGFKTYEPYNVPGNKWFKSYFKKPVFNLGINYPF